MLCKLCDNTFTWCMILLCRGNLQLDSHWWKLNSSSPNLNFLRGAQYFHMLRKSFWCNFAGSNYD